MSITNKENISSTSVETGKQGKQNQLDFHNPDKLFSQLDKNISKEVFKQISLNKQKLDKKIKKFKNKLYFIF